MNYKVTFAFAPDEPEVWSKINGNYKCIGYYKHLFKHFRDGCSFQPGLFANNKIPKSTLSYKIEPLSNSELFLLML